MKKLSGQLKIFFGASAGVGKTLLLCFRAVRAAPCDEGADLWFGIAETMAAAKPLPLLEGLDVLPARAYRGIAAASSVIRPRRPLRRGVRCAH